MVNGVNPSGARVRIVSVPVRCATEGNHGGLPVRLCATRERRSPNLQAQMHSVRLHVMCNDIKGMRLLTIAWIPACAGMTKRGRNDNGGGYSFTSTVLFFSEFRDEGYYKRAGVMRERRPPSLLGADALRTSACDERL